MKTAATQSKGRPVRARPSDYKTVTIFEDGLYAVTAPGIPGVFGLSKSASAAKSDFKSAMQTLLDYMHEIGEPAPMQANR